MNPEQIDLPTICKHGLELRHCPLCVWPYEEKTMKKPEQIKEIVAAVEGKERAMSERRFDFWVSDDSGRMIPAMPTGITEAELKRRLHIIEESDFGPESQIQVLLHGEELYTKRHDFMTEDPPTETREESKASVRLLHKILNASIFGWPEGELEKAHQMLDEISSMPR